jgi:hypothetical protein
LCISYTLVFLKHNGKEKCVGPVREPIHLFDLLLLLLNILTLPYFKITFTITCFHSRTVHLDIIKVFYLPTDAQSPSSGSAYLSLLKLLLLTVVTLASLNVHSQLVVIALKHVGAVLI